MHRELSFALKPEVLIFTRLFADGEPTDGAERPARLPGRYVASELPAAPPAVATPLVPYYSEIVRTVADRLERDLSEFRGVRFE